MRTAVAWIAPVPGFRQMRKRSVLVGVSRGSSPRQMRALPLIIGRRSPGKIHCASSRCCPVNRTKRSISTVCKVQPPCFLSAIDSFVLRRFAFPEGRQITRRRCERSVKYLHCMRRRGGAIFLVCPDTSRHRRLVAPQQGCREEFEPLGSCAPNSPHRVPGSAANSRDPNPSGSSRKPLPVHILQREYCASSRPTSILRLGDASGMRGAIL